MLNSTGKKQDTAPIATFEPGPTPQNRISTGNRMIFGVGANQVIQRSSAAAMNADAPNTRPIATPSTPPIASAAANSPTVTIALRQKLGSVSTAHSPAANAGSGGTTSWNSKPDTASACHAPNSSTAAIKRGPTGLSISPAAAAIALPHRASRRSTR